MKKSRHVVTGSASLLLISLGLIACSAARDQCIDPLGCLEIPPGSPLIIGSLLVSVGPQAPAGDETRLGIMQVIDERDRLFDHPIQLDEWTSDCSKKDIRTGAVNLALHSDLVAVIGPACAGQHADAASILSNAGLPLLDPAPGQQSAAIITRNLLSAIERVTVQDADGTLHIPRQALLDALEQTP